MVRALFNSGFPTSLLHPFRPTAADAEGRFRLNMDRLVWAVPLLVGAFALVAAFVGWAIDPGRFYFSYVTAWSFCVSISLGALFFVMMHHITRSHWGIVVRRIAETLAIAFPLLVVASIPVLIGLLTDHLYEWTHHTLYVEGGAEYDPVLAKKHGYLNVPFFLIRFALYFVTWSWLAHRLYRLSVSQDVEADRSIPAKQRKVSAIGIPIYAVTVAFASYDFLMSLYPHWFSTIFGVYFFAGAFWAFFALLIVMAATLQRTGSGLNGVITVDHYHDLGKWLFAFTIFWAYIAFSQYMLIWYGNLPEETVWYRYRMEGGWGWHSAMLIIMHFILPFLILISRPAKRSLFILSVMAVWALVMHWFDLHWIALPNYHPDAHGAALPDLTDVAGREAVTGDPTHGATSEMVPHDVDTHASTFHWLDFACWFGLFGLYVGIAFLRLSRHSAVPRNDPRLDLSLHFHNT